MIFQRRLNIINKENHTTVKKLVACIFLPLINACFLELYAVKNIFCFKAPDDLTAFIMLNHEKNPSLLLPPRLHLDKELAKELANHINRAQITSIRMIYYSQMMKLNLRTWRDGAIDSSTRKILRGFTSWRWQYEYLFLRLETCRWKVQTVRQC